MWKYVTRRVKETVERSYNVLDVRKTWNFGAQQTNETGDTNVDRDFEYECKIKPIERAVDKCLGLWFLRWDKSSNRHSSSGEGGTNKEDCKQQQQFSDSDNTLLGAITWSGAIICGWYASQLLCLHRRHLGWENHTRCTTILNVPNRSLHSNVLSQYVLLSPNQPSLVTQKTLREKFYHDQTTFANNNYSQSAKLFEVNNEECFPRTEAKQTVNDAISDLVTFLGETEFKIGVKNIAAGRYQSAVEHLKIATSHNHPGATFNLGLCYEKGLGVRKNMKRAMECYQIASSLGHSKAMYNLGVFYAHGLGGLETNRDVAHECFKTSAKLGQREAKSVLGLNSESNNKNMKPEIYDFTTVKYI